MYNKMLDVLKGKLPTDKAIGVYGVFPLLLLLVELMTFQAGEIDLTNQYVHLGMAVISLYISFSSIVIFSVLLRNWRSNSILAFFRKHIFMLILFSNISSWGTVYLAANNKL